MLNNQVDTKKVKENIHPFNFSGVQLKQGRFKKQFDDMKEYYLNIPNDNILKGFRERAKIDAPGEDLGGWYTGDSTFLRVHPEIDKPSNVFSAFGQWLGAFARMYKVTQDQRIKSKLEYLLHEWGKAIAPDGYFYYGNNPNGPHYEFDKTVGGLVDIYEYVGFDVAMDYLKKITKWAEKGLNRRRIPPTPDNFTGGGYTGGFDSDNEWYTLSENLYRAYLLTHDEFYKNFGETWHYNTYWNDLASNQHCMTALHAYSHVNTLSSAAMAYKVTGNELFLNAILNAYEIFKNKLTFATGGYGPWERLSNQYGSLGNSLWLEERSFEAPCGSWAVFKITRYLLSLTGKAFYGDWTEKILFNGIGACLPMAENGKTFYYSDYRVTGGLKKYYSDTWPCCSGTYPLAVTDYHNIIYFYDDEGIYINLFVPSQVDWETKGTSVRVVQETDFPEQNKIHLKIQTANPVEFSIKFRIPGWIKEDVSIKVNGKERIHNFKIGDWGNISQTWENGDTIDIKLPMQLEMLPVDSQHLQLVALCYGPVVLASNQPGPLKAEIKNPSKRIQRIAQDKLVFQANDNLNFKPYYSYQEGEVYYLYNLINKD
ncbi:beta-L-arabinofuranosidase domain-containing protein [Atribacter laminatus]|jgi:DUF1680 family protein|uniref:Non-reducing end beta-L-arabinofuranosidase n=1 Tax=Atribacter laminatus TaxID=2847778 RepID=A0A7T1F2X4_ATRLM|nr:beta-L-arabinofuranosidase domain-containing protein [Atribacter laminatus]QPM68145.1 Non-reducing end beta-L-arabinofuranosidase [Atribacter laminatus]